jgi:hypothetical protein
VPIPKYTTASEGTPSPNGHCGLFARYGQPAIEAFNRHKGDPIFYDQDTDLARLPDPDHNLESGGAYSPKAPGEEIIPLDRWREVERGNRLAAVGNIVRHERFGLALVSGSPTGTGKSTADGAVIKAYPPDRRVLLAFTTHREIEQCVRMLGEQGIDVAPYPEASSITCQRYPEVQAVRAAGLNFQSILCPECPFRGECLYYADNNRAAAARVAATTYARLEVAMWSTTKGRSDILANESPLNMLRPKLVAAKGFSSVRDLADHACRYVSAEDRQRGYDVFFRQMGEISTDFQAIWEGLPSRGRGGYRLDLPEPAGKVPRDPDPYLWELIQTHGITPPGDTLRLVMKAAAGQLHSLAATYNSYRVKSGVHAGKERIHRALVGVCRTPLPRELNFWNNDATVNRRYLKGCTGRPLIDLTPMGMLARVHPVIQIPEDVTRQTSPLAAAAKVRGILHDLPRYLRVGILTHSTLANVIRETVGLPHATRIVKVDYFGSGSSRGDNSWMAECDLLIVLGTPRVAIHDIRDMLFRLSKIDAACLSEAEAGWTEVRHVITATYPDVGRVSATVPLRRYRQSEWHEAYCYLVRTELIHSLGRARPYNHDGIPCVCVTVEDLGEHTVISPHPFYPISTAQARVLRELYRTDAKGEWVRLRRTVPQIAAALGLAAPTVREELRDLREDGRVEKAGERLGWFPTLPPKVDLPLR